LFWWILLGIVSLLVLLPLLFLLLRRPAVVASAPVPVAAVVPAPPPVAVPQIVPCPICGNPLSPADGKWYCGTCHRRIFIAP
jgi:hypothetical protein